MNDRIYLLSIEEYEKYKKNIPLVNCWWWWLRSPGYDSDRAAGVTVVGSIDYEGCFVYYDYDAVRPALVLDTSGIIIGQRVVRHDFPWIVVDDGVAIAEVPIAFQRFDVQSNDYENSEIRKFLLKWMEERK